MFNEREFKSEGAILRGRWYPSQEGQPASSVLAYAEQSDGKLTYWKINRAFEV